MPMPTPTPMPMPMPMPMPGRRFRGPLVGGILIAALAVAAALSGRVAAAQGRSRNDAANAQALLDAMKGTGSVACSFAMGVVEGNGGWGHWTGGSGVGEDQQSADLRDWLDDGLTDPAVVPMLKSAMGQGDACVRQTAARLLGRSKNLTAVRALIDALRDPDPVTRELAALALGLSGDPAGFDPLVAALRDTAARVRATSAVSLGRLGDHKAMEKLVPVLAHDPAPEVRRAAAYALGELD
jgi:HEAT repeat protein